MDDARRKELLASFPAPWKVYGERYFAARGEALGCIAAPIIDGHASDAELAEILVEAFNAHFGGEHKKDVGNSLEHRFFEIARAAGCVNLDTGMIPVSRLDEVVTAVLSWKRDSEELAQRKASPGEASLLKGFGGFGSVAGLTGEKSAPVNQDMVERVCAKVRAWKADSEELAARKRDDEDLAKIHGDGAEISPEMDQAFADLARQDCRRAATRLGKLFDWNKAEALLAGEILFMELRSRERQETAEKCGARSLEGRTCTLPRDHKGVDRVEGFEDWHDDGSACWAPGAGKKLP